MPLSVFESIPSRVRKFVKSGHIAGANSGTHELTNSQINIETRTVNCGPQKQVRASHLEIRKVRKRSRQHERKGHLRGLRNEHPEGLCCIPYREHSVRWKTKSYRTNKGHDDFWFHKASAVAPSLFRNICNHSGRRNHLCEDSMPPKQVRISRYEVYDVHLLTSRTCDTP